MGLYTVITVLIIIICVMLSLVVLIQNPKGGGLSATFGGVGNSILGARKSTDFIEKATWTLAIGLLLFSLLSAAFVEKKTVVNDLPRSVMESAEDLPFTAPVAPTNTPNINAPAEDK